MLPNPLHPAVVHFPLVLAVLLPLFALGALWAIRLGARPTRAWALPLAIGAALTVSAYVAVRTGEADEDRVEDVVGDRAMHAHEEAAERFLVLSGVLFAIGALGALRGNVGTAARFVTTAGSIGVLVAGIQVGKAGGELVYEHNAASVYSMPEATANAGAVDKAASDQDERPN